MTRIKRKVQYIFISLFSSPSLDVDHFDDKARMDQKLYFRQKILFSVYSSSPADPIIVKSELRIRVSCEALLLMILSSAEKNCFSSHHKKNLSSKPDQKSLSISSIISIAGRWSLGRCRHFKKLPEHVFYNQTGSLCLVSTETVLVHLGQGQVDFRLTPCLTSSNCNKINFL